MGAQEARATGTGCVAGRSQRAGRRRACPWDRAGRAQLLTVPTGATSLWGKQRQKPPPRAAQAQAGLLLNFLENRNSPWRSVTHPDDHGVQALRLQWGPCSAEPTQGKGAAGASGLSARCWAVYRHDLISSSQPGRLGRHSYLTDGETEAQRSL